MDLQSSSNSRRVDASKARLGRLEATGISLAAFPSTFHLTPRHLTCVDECPSKTDVRPLAERVRYVQLQTFGPDAAHLSARIVFCLALHRGFWATIRVAGSRE